MDARDDVAFPKTTGERFCLCAANRDEVFDQYESLNHAPIDLVDAQNLLRVAKRDRIIMLAQ